MTAPLDTAGPYIAAEAALAARALAPLADAFAGKTILLSGARGLLGRYTVEIVRAMNRSCLKSNPCWLIAMDATPASQTLVEADQLDTITQITKDVRGLAPRVVVATGWAAGAINKIDYVVHMAGLASPVVYKKFPLLTIEVAVDGSRRLLEVAHEYGAKYLFTSTSEVLQTPPPECIPTNERYVGAIPTMTDRAPYDVSKALGETLTFTYWRQHGLHAINVRLFNSFGAGMAEKDQRILPRLASSIVAKRALTVYGHDERTLPTRTYCPAANTAYGILLALVKGKPAGLYHIGAPNPEITVPELCKLAARVLGREVPYQLMPPPDVYETEPRRRCPDIGLAQRELGYELVVPLEDGLKSFLSWALSVYTGEGA